jgi:glucose/arabinose dehydrogenase
MADGGNEYSTAPTSFRYFCTNRLVVVLSLLLPCLLSGPAYAVVYPSGFYETTLFTGLRRPTAVRFSPDGRIFVGEKSGIIKVYNDLSDTTPDIFVDLSFYVHDYLDRGLLGLALDPNFPAQPYVYVFYTYDYDFGRGTGWGDTCPDPPGANTDGCVVDGRISKLEISPNNTLVGSEFILLENKWCQQYPSHSVGALVFGPEGALYATAGDGASFVFTDYGQGGGHPNSPTPPNPCGDPPAGRGGAEVPPTAEGGALRSQDIRTTGDVLGLSGTVLRLDPTTGQAWPDNPLIGGDPTDDRIIGYGLRNPYRFTIRPGTNQVWIGDVGWGTWEEINKLNNPLASPIQNFGWPCYEGNSTQPGYDAANLTLCENLYTEATATPPFYAYNHNSDVDPNGDGCRTGGSSISGMAFYVDGPYPANYQGALFFADYSRACIYIIKKGGDGEPDLSTRTAFAVDATDPVDLEIGPGGDLYFVDYADNNTGTVKRVQYTAQNQPPTADAAATPTSGEPPLTVQFDGSGSTDPNPGTTLFYKWDLDGDGQYDDANIVNPTFTYTSNGTITVKLQVTDDDGASSTDQIVITVGNTAPTATITAPLPSLTWHVGDSIAFAGQANDPEQGNLPPSAFHWDVILHHCPQGGGCHTHFVQSYDGVASGNFPAPDHEYPSYLEFVLTVTDAGGLTDVKSVSVQPVPVTLTFLSNPTGAAIVAGEVSGNAPFSRDVIVNSTISISAITPQTINNTLYYFVSWSDGGAQTHNITSGVNPESYTATYAPCVAPTGSVALSVSSTQISWAPLNGATSYDIVRGDLQTLRSTGGDFTAATQQCVANDTTGTSIPYSTNPSAGQAFWFLIRGVNCGGNGSYASSGTGQQQNPDPEINASPNSCP